MSYRSVVRDCLYLNWALPVSAMPRLPGGLRYEQHCNRDGAAVAFMSALLMKQTAFGPTSFPLASMAFPQLNVRVYVMDAQSVPSVYFMGLFVPSWILPLVWLSGSRGFSRARIELPRVSGRPGRSKWRWSVAGKRRLVVSGEPGPPSEGDPGLGGWEGLCDHLRRRDRGYLPVGNVLERVETEHSPTAIWPMKVSVHDVGLLRQVIGFDGEWPDLHSAWLCPEMPLTFAVNRSESTPVRSEVPAPG